MRQTRQEMFIHHISTIIHRSNLGRNSERVIQEKIKKRTKSAAPSKASLFYHSSTLLCGNGTTSSLDLLLQLQQ